MDKSKIKSFAVWARRNLIKQVSEKANRIGIYEDKIIEAIAVQGGFKLEGKDEIFPLSKSDRDALVSQVKEKGFEQVMEEIAYTWFNRFMGLRYMEVNDYLPSGVRILSSEVKGKKEPDVLTKVSEIIEELELNANEIYDLLDTGNTLDREKAYRIILVKQCNALGKIIPQMFEKISDYTELLLPDNLLEEDSVIRRMVEDVEEEDWLEEVEIIGWMYEDYIDEKRDEVSNVRNKASKINKEILPVVTQLFTPKWIVKYLVENSILRLHGISNYVSENYSLFKYYVPDAKQLDTVSELIDESKINLSAKNIEDIKIIDPCMGSGHILVYAFDVLYEIYKILGYSEREIPRIILKNNLYGLDIDDRAVQLASFALIMKARHYNRRLFREIEKDNLELNLCSIKESNDLNEEIINYFSNGDENIKSDIKCLVNNFIDAKEYGSILDVQDISIKKIESRIEEIRENQTSNLIYCDYNNIILSKLPYIIKQYKIMNDNNYDCIITNPPYLGIRKYNNKLYNYVEKNFTDCKHDLFSVMMQKCIDISNENSIISMITPHSWMFLGSFEKLRRYIIEQTYIENMMHIGIGAFGADHGTTAFVLRNSHMKDYIGTFIKLDEFKNVYEKKQKFFDEKYRFFVETEKFADIEGYPIAYWLTDKAREIFKTCKKLNECGETKQGLATSDNDRFLKLWHEVNLNNIAFKCKGKNDAISLGKKWFPCNKGGEFRKWYGNNYWVINWENDGFEIKDYAKSLYKSYTRTIKNIPFYFKEGLTWSSYTSRSISVRYCDEGFIFETKGSMYFPNNYEEYMYYLGFLNSKIVNELLKVFSPTVDYHEGPIGQLPCKVYENNRINICVEDNIKFSKNDWDSFEVSWDFKIHPLLKLLSKGEQYKLSSVFNLWEKKCEENFYELKKNEEELNKIFIDMYGLQDELTPEVEDKDITIRKADRERDIKSLISYAVGCMFGRYSIDIEGLIYAGGDFNDKWNFENNKVRNIEKDEEGNIISDLWIDSRFMPDRENIVPITEDEYFEDDIVTRFIEFVRTIYGNETLEENLDFIADSIGRKTSETARQAIRRYFIKDFYKDHLKVYKSGNSGSRPIYWMFESGKNHGFKCLIYMHRYNEQTVAKVRTDYLHTLQRKYEAEINRLQLVVDSEEYTAKDRTAAKKKIDRISKQIEECREYDQVVAHLANEKISIDLDDGVKVNYAKFQDIKVINSKGKEVKMNLLSKI